MVLHKTIPHHNLPVKSIVLVALAGILIPFIRGAVAEEPTGPFRFQEVSPSSLGLWEGNQPVLVYNHGLVRPPEQVTGKPRASYIHPLYGLDGEVLTDDFPKDHTYHRGVYWAWPHLKIGDREF